MPRQWHPCSLLRGEGSVMRGPMRISKSEIWSVTHPVKNLPQSWRMCWNVGRTEWLETKLRNNLSPGLAFWQIPGAHPILQLLVQMYKHLISHDDHRCASGPLPLLGSTHLSSLSVLTSLAGQQWSNSHFRHEGLETREGEWFLPSGDNGILMELTWLVRNHTLFILLYCFTLALCVLQKAAYTG